MYDYGYTAESVADATMASAGLTGLAIGILIFSLILSILLIICYIKALKKAGVSALNILWLFIPIVANVVLALKIDPVKKFGKGTGYLVGLILLPIIFVPLIAFSDKNANEEININTNQQFDATNIINAAKTDDVNLNNQGFNVVMPSIPQENAGMENNIASATSEINVKNEVDNVQPDIGNVQTVPTDLNSVSGLDIHPETVQDFDSGAFNSIEETTQPENVVSQEPVSVFNANPVVETVQPVNVENVVEQEPVSVFNASPVVETIQPVNVESADVVGLQPETLEINNQNSQNESTKKCKNCGNDLPEIVSICPNCGTDNE